MAASGVTIAAPLGKELAAEETDIFEIALEPEAGQIEAAETELVAVLDRFREEEDERDLKEQPRGSWSWHRVRDHIVIVVVDCVSPAEAVEEVATHLSEHGIAGLLSQPAEDSVPRIEQGYVLECRLQPIAGDEPPVGLFHPPLRAAYDRVLEVAISWCLDLHATSPVAYRKGLASPELVKREADLQTKMREEDFTYLWTSVGGITRMVSAHFLQARISLLVSCPFEDRARVWPRSYDSLKYVMNLVAEDLAYGLVKVDRDSQDPSRGRSINERWPVRGEFKFPELLASPEATKLWDHKVPDAFGLQLLGRQHEFQDLEAPSYRSVAIGPRTLVEGRDLEAWFGEPLVPESVHWTEVADFEAPEFLNQARAEFGPLLIQPADLGLPRAQNP